jgi:adenine-specific DNA-methyltransferase
VASNIAQLKALFPELITEGKDGAAVNIDVLKQWVGDKTVADADEKSGLNWHGKRRARQLALTPSTGTLRPCPDESVDWDTTQNLMIEGENLEVLKLLQKSYAGKVKLTYIDPPYNTGKDFVYPDNFQDSIKNYLQLTGQVEDGTKISSNSEASGRFNTDWLNMMYPRLKLARNLLREDGVLFVSIDEKEIQNFRMIGNDVFGEECFVAAITLLCNPKGRSQDKYFATNHEYVVVYSKSVLPKGAFAIAKDEDQIEAEYPEEDEGGKYRLLELRNTHRDFGKHNRRNLYYALFTNDGGEVFLDSGEGRHHVVPDWDDGFEGCWTWDKNKAEKDLFLLAGQFVGGRWKIYRKSYASGADRMLKTILTDKAYFTERGQKEFNSLFATRSKLFQSPKSPHLIAQLIQTSTSEGDLVLDFFGGSGTTGHAVMIQNVSDGSRRRFVLVQLPESIDPEEKEQKPAADYCDALNKPRNIAELTKERLRRAGAKVKADNPEFAGDTGFRVYKLDNSNIRAWQPSGNLEKDLLDNVEHILPDRSEADVLTELLLKLGLDLCVPIEKKTIAGKTVHSIGGGVLLACLDPKISEADAEPLALGIAEWHKALAPAGDSTCVFRDSAFANDVAKTNLAAILDQHGISQVRSL